MKKYVINMCKTCRSRSLKIIGNSITIHSDDNTIISSENQLYVVDKHCMGSGHYVEIYDDISELVKSEIIEIPGYNENAVRITRSEIIDHIPITLYGIGIKLRGYTDVKLKLPDDVKIENFTFIKEI